MTNYSEAEIGALETSFPGTTIYLCDLHVLKMLNGFLIISVHVHGCLQLILVLKNNRTTTSSRPLNP